VFAEEGLPGGAEALEQPAFLGAGNQLRVIVGIAALRRQRGFHLLQEAIPFRCAVGQQESQFLAVQFADVAAQLHDCPHAGQPVLGKVVGSIVNARHRLQGGSAQCQHQQLHGGEREQELAGDLQVTEPLHGLLLDSGDRSWKAQVPQGRRISQHATHGETREPRCCNTKLQIYY
jgi:hypothetical protein